MYASPFDYVAVSEWEEAVDFLQEHAGDEPRVIAGGQSLVPIMNLRLAEPSHLVDLNGISAEEIRRDDDILAIPALTRHTDLETSSLVARGCPLLAEAASLIGNARVRHRGTIGGSLAHADPSAELPCAVVAAGGTVVTTGPSGQRAVPAGEFFRSYYATALEPGELIREVRVPIASPMTGSAFVEFGRRAGDFAVVEVAAIVEIEGSGACGRVEIVAGGVGERPVRLEEAASLMIGGGEAEIGGAAERAGRMVEPAGNGYASAEYRRHLTEILTRRALAEALRRAREGSGGA